MYVVMESNSNYASGDGPTDYNTYVEDSAFLKPIAELAGLIAHEEQHQYGLENREHTVGVGETAGEECTL